MPLLPSSLDVARRAAGLLRPTGVAYARDAWRFGEDHDLQLSRSRQLRVYARARDMGLHLLPPMPLDGLVVDVGANEGSFTDAVLAAEPRAHVLAIEPAPAVNATLRAHYAGDARVVVVDQAVSDRAGTAQFNVTDLSVFSSLRSPRAAIDDLYENRTSVTEQVTVTTSTLDDIVGDREVRLLKIDVQGSEAELLRGARNVLSRTNAVLIEVLFMSHYEGDMTFSDLHATMGERGFVLAGLSEPYVQAGRVLWADACYVPAPAA